MVQDNPTEQVTPDYTTEQKLPAITVNTSPRLEEAPDFEHVFNQFPKLEPVTQDQHSELETAHPKLVADVNEQNMFPKHYEGFTPSAKAMDYENQPHLYNEEATKFMEDRGARPGDTVSEKGSTDKSRYLGPDPKIHGGEHNFAPVPPALKSDKISSRDDLVDQNQSKLAEIIHDLRVKFMGDPEKWSTKEEVGNFINQAMSVMGAGIRVPKLPGTALRQPFKGEVPKADNMNKESYQIDPTPYEQAQLDASWNALGNKMSKPDLKTVPTQKAIEAMSDKEFRDYMTSREQDFVDNGGPSKKPSLSSLMDEVDALHNKNLVDPYEKQVAIQQLRSKIKLVEQGLTTETIPQQQQAQHMGPVPPKTMVTPLQEQLVKYETLSSQGKTTKQIVKATKMDPETVRDNLGRDNLAIAAFNSENALTSAYFKSLQNLDPALGQAIKNAVSVKDLKRYTRNLPEAQLKTIFEELPPSVKESFMSGEARREAIDAGKKTKIIARPVYTPKGLSEADYQHVRQAVKEATKGIKPLVKTKEETP